VSACRLCCSEVRQDVLNLLMKLAAAASPEVALGIMRIRLVAATMQSLHVASQPHRYNSHFV
jgi:hypothetical protein